MILEGKKQIDDFEENQEYSKMGGGAVFQYHHSCCSGI